MTIAASSSAQTPSAPLVEVDPLRCWWRTSEGAVAVGQPFSVVLTCAVLETDSVRVVPDESPLAVGSVQLAPFELVGGSHPADLRSGPRRFFQYDYTVRIIDPTVIGKDVSLPTLSIHYRVESKVQAQALEGRDRLYLLPAHAVHVLSMVPSDATDIRDGSDASFGVIEGLRFRGRVLDIFAMALAVLGMILLVPAVTRLFGVSRQRAREEKTPGLSDRAVLNAVLSELTSVQTGARSGWTPELVARALAAARVVAGYALGRRPSQRVLAAAAEAPDTGLVVTHRGFKRLRVTVWSPVTADDLARALDGPAGGASSALRSVLEPLQESIATLTSAVYSQPGAPAPAADDEVATVLRAGERVRHDYGWLRVAAKRLLARG